MTTFLSRAARAHAFARLSVLAAAALVACGGGGDTPRDMGVEEDADVVSSAAPVNVDDGRRHAMAASEQAAAAAPGFIPTGDPNAQTQGVFGPVVPLPLMPIHQVLLPDGRVLFYGSDITGLQGGGLHYAVWEPAAGTGPDAFTVLPQVTGSNLFCAGQSLLPDTGDALLIGGTTMVQGLNGWGIADVNLFSASGNTMTAQAPMNYVRWYPTLLTLVDGTQLALGGRMDPAYGEKGSGDAKVRAAAPAASVASAPATYATRPELWSRTAGWRDLPGADDDTVFGSLAQGWYYPRAWVMPTGDVFVLANSGATYRMTTAGAGALQKYAPTVAIPVTEARTQAVMYQPGKILAVRTRSAAVTVDITGTTPLVARTPPSSRYRLYGNATLLADGQVWLNGGSSQGNVLTNDHFVSEMWNPATARWSDMATATIPRLYHSSAILLPDATVMTGGGGDPGPVTNLNAEIYYPSYLYLKDGSGTPAPRPAITSAPDVLGWGENFAVSVSSATAISRVTLVRTGVVTHNFNENQRFQELGFTVKKGQLNMKSPTRPGIAPPGYYMLFVFDANGVPSMAKILRIGA